MFSNMCSNSGRHAQGYRNTNKQVDNTFARTRTFFHVHTLTARTHARTHTNTHARARTHALYTVICNSRALHFSQLTCCRRTCWSHGLEFQRWDSRAERRQRRWWRTWRQILRHPWRTAGRKKKNARDSPTTKTKTDSAEITSSFDNKYEAWCFWNQFISSPTSNPMS